MRATPYLLLLASCAAPEIPPDATLLKDPFKEASPARAPDPCAAPCRAAAEADEKCSAAEDPCQKAYNKSIATCHGTCDATTELDLLSCESDSSCRSAVLAANQRCWTRCPPKAVHVRACEDRDDRCREKKAADARLGSCRCG